MLPADPKMRKLGRGRGVRPLFLCSGPGCEEELNEVTVKNLDPFCSVKCAHAYHGVEIPLPFKGQTVASSS